MLCPARIGIRIEHRSSVEEDPVNDHTATRIPNRCAEYAARPDDAPHLGDRPLGSWNELQHEQRQDAVETVIGNVQSAGISNPECNSRIVIAVRRMLNVGGREIDAVELSGAASLRQRKGEAAGAASHIENMLTVNSADEVKKRFCEAPAPASHLQLVSVAVDRVECRGNRHV